MSRRTQLIGAIAAVAIGLIVGFMIHAHPEGLRVPAWVAYVAASGFVLAGLCLLAGAVELDRLQRWLGIAVTLALLVISSWIAFGPGERECSMSFAFLRGVAPDAACRGAFGVGVLLIAIFLGVLAYGGRRQAATARVRRSVDDQQPKRRNPLIVAAMNLRSATATVVAAALGAVVGAMAAAKLPSDKFAWTGLALLPLFVLVELLLKHLATLFDDDRNAARFALAGAIVVGFYGAWFGVRTQ